MRGTAVAASMALVLAVACAGADQAASTPSRSDTSTTPTGQPVSPSTPIGPATSSVTEAPPSTPVGTIAPASISSDFSIVAALDQMPIGEERSFTLVGADLITASALAGVTRPDDPAAAPDWLEPLTGGGKNPAPIFVPVPVSLGRSDIDEVSVFEDALGWSIVDVDQFVDWSNPRLGSFTVVSGAFDEETLAPTLVPIGDGIVTHFEGADGEQHILDGDVISRAGQPVRLAYAGGRIGFGRSTPMTRAWLEGAHPTIGDDQAVRSIGEALDAAGVVSVIIVAGDRRAVLSPAVITTRFDTAAVGWSVHDGAATITMLWAPTDPATAETLAMEVESVLLTGDSRLGRMAYAEFFDAVEVGATQGLVHATVRARTASDVRLAQVAIEGPDTLFVHA